MRKKRVASKLACAAGVVALFCSTAHAAVTVLGPGPAKQCFQVAELGGDARSGIMTCDMALESALSITDRAATYVNRGVIELSLRQTDKAIADINAGLTLAPDLGDAYVDRGAVSIALGHFDDAMADLNKGIALGSHRLEIAYYDRAIINEQRGDIRSAYEDYKKALEIEPGFVRAADELKRFRVTHKRSGA